MDDRFLREIARPRIAPDAGPRDALADLADLVGGESDRSRRFLGGLIAGALVGAAIVGAAGAAFVRRHEGTGRQG